MTLLATALALAWAQTQPPAQALAPVLALAQAWALVWALAWAPQALAVALQPPAQRVSFWILLPQRIFLMCLIDVTTSADFRQHAS